MMMNEFNIERALAGEKVITRDGNKVKGLHVFDIQKEQTLYGIMDNNIESWNCIGQYHNGKSCDSDLFMAPKKLSGFVNVYSNKDECAIYPTKIDADGGAMKEVRIACIDLSQFNEGHGL